ncbi:MAG TPA: hypothetical protein VHM89_13505 [Acidimicrobiales bacterium]|nr:hypothetical protein [Acidimicrobiales bacterium]
MSGTATDAGDGAGDGNDEAGRHRVEETTKELLGTPIRIGCTSSSLAAAVAELFSAFPSVAAGEPAHRFVVVDGCATHGRERCVHTGSVTADVSGDAGTALSWLLTAVNGAALDGFAGLAVHAGVVASGTSAIAFPAPSGAGKTTLTAAALLAGFDYVSDEALCVEPSDGRLVPYPRALALSAWSRQAVGLDGTDGVALGAGEVAIPADRLGAAVALGPLALAHVVLLVRRAGAPALVPADRADAMTWLLQRSFNHYKRPTGSFELAAELARRATAWRLEFGDPTQAASLLRDRLG